VSLNVVVVSEEFPPETGWGGLATYSRYLARGLSRRGHTVTVIAGGETRRTVSVDGIRLIRLPTPTSVRPGSIGRIRSVLGRSRLVAEVIRKLKPDIVEAPEWKGEGLVSTMRRSAPLTSRLHTPLDLLMKLGDLPYTFPSRVIGRLERLQVRLSDGVTCSIAELLESLQSLHWFKKHVEIIPNFIDIQYLEHNLGSPKTLEIKDEQDDYLLYYGRLEWKKGVHLLASALPGFLRAHRDAKVILVGRDSGYGQSTMRAYLDAGLKGFRSQLHFTGFVEESEKIRLIANSRLVVLPSLWEGFGFSILEAMALGKPVVTTPVGGIKTIVRGAECAYLVPPNDATALGDMLIRAWDDPGRHRVGNAARHRATSFSADSVVPLIESHYVDVISA